MNTKVTHVDLRRVALLDAATEILAVQPTASLADIAAAARISKATLHRYFPSRDDLILALAYRAVELVRQAVADSEPDAGSLEEALTRLARVLIPLGDKIHFLLDERFLDAHPALNAAEQEAQAPLHHMIEQRQATGELRSDISDRWMLHVLNYLLFATWKALNDGLIAQRDAEHLFVTTCMYGMTRR